MWGKEPVDPEDVEKEEKREKKREKRREEECFWRGIGFLWGKNLDAQ